MNLHQNSVAGWATRTRSRTRSMIWMSYIHSLWQVFFTCIQLFRQRLSQESVKAYVTMPIGIMGSTSLALLDWLSRWFSDKERERTNTRLCCLIPQRWNTLSFTQATGKTTITHNNFRNCRISFPLFVRQTFSKRLYTFTYFKKNYENTSIQR